MLPKPLSTALDRVTLIALRAIPPRLARRFLHLIYDHPRLTDRWEFHIRPHHFYEPLPDFARLDPARVAARRESAAIDWRLPQQLQLLQNLAAFAEEIAGLAGPFDFDNDTFRDFDAALCYALIRHLKPRRVIEIGGGNSTRITAIALERNATPDTAHLCIEPYPSPLLDGLPVRILREKAEDISLDTFATLESGDILFIDSTHTVKFGSDVCREILEILPALAGGVWIHLHDIFFPYDYPPRWILEQRRSWAEQYLLEAFLAFNDAFQVEAAAHWLATDHPDEAAALWPGIRSWPRPSHGAGSFWLRKKR